MNEKKRTTTVITNNNQINKIIKKKKDERNRGIAGFLTNTYVFFFKARERESIFMPHIGCKEHVCA
jgi:hypothetical protein